MSMNQIARRLTLSDLIVPNGQTNEQEEFHSKPYISRLKGKTEGQINALSVFEHSIITFCYGPSGTGKAQPLDSKILTPNGWRLMGDIKVNDEISTPDGNTAKVTNIYPQGLVDIYKVTFEDGISTECCENHLWKIFHIEKGWIVEPLHKIQKYLKTNYLAKYIGVPLTKPVVFKNNSEIKLDPYLLGCLIGDGCLTIRVGFSSSDKEIIDNLSNIIADYDCTIKYNSKYDYSIIGKEFRKNKILESIKELGLYGKKSDEKFIPEIYLNSDIETRFALLQGLMDTDGTVDKNKSIQYCTVSEKLAEQVAYLVRSLGGLCKIRHKKTSYTYNKEKKSGKKAYILHIRFAKPKLLFRLNRKLDRLNETNQYSKNLKRRIKNIEYVGKKEAQCISIDSEEHLYITNDFIVTHNTYLAIGKALEWLHQGLVSRIILSKPVLECGEKLGFMPGKMDEKIEQSFRPLTDKLHKFLDEKIINRYIAEKKIEQIPLAYMRGLDLDNACLILDEAQNTTKGQLLMFMTRLGENSRAIICGDTDQTDLKEEDDGAFHKYIYEATKSPYIDGLEVAELTEDDIVRNTIVQKIVKKFSKIKIK
jgi:phosphate starvation-inducible protein PhoH